MAHRIEVSSGQSDTALKNFIEAETGIVVDSVKTAKVFTIDTDLQEPELNYLGSELFSDPITETFSTTPIGNQHEWDFAIEIQYKPGITDIEGKTSTQAIRDMTGQSYPVYTSRQYLLKGANRTEAEAIAARLANFLVQNVKVKSREEWNPGDGMGIFIPTPNFDPEDHLYYGVRFDVSDEELERFSNDKCLALNAKQFRAIEARYPKVTDEEIEVIAQRWSEHCNHNITNAQIRYSQNGHVQIIDSLFRTYIRGATEELQRRGLDWIVSVFSDNAGIIRLDDEFNIAFKAETHNSPSFIDQYMGALTGVDGLARDIFGAGKGAKEIARLDVLCFGDPTGKAFAKYPNIDALMKNVRHPRRMFEGVRSGVRDGGNKCGVPTVNGSVVFDSYPFGSVMHNLKGIDTAESYMGRPLVYCGSLGIMPAYINGKPTHVKKANAGDAIILVGGRTGKDGIHGATGSSRIHDENTPVTMVQMDEAIVQRNAFDYQLDARDKDLYESISDNGAGGISCSASEMGHESGGAEVDLDKMPLKYPGMIPREILISESQNRMTWAVRQERVEEALDLAKRYGVEATVIGKFTDDGYFRVNFKGRKLAELDLEFLRKGSPSLTLDGKWQQPVYMEPNFKEPDAEETLLQLLSRPNIVSKETTVRTYDHEVMGQTIVKPFSGAKNDGPSDSAVVWPIEMRTKGSYRGVSVSHGINPRYGFVDTYHMAASSIDEAIRNAVASGADPKRIALLDNFCWSSPTDPYRVAQLERAFRACYDYSVDFGTPFISGKDSMHNDFWNPDDKLRISVPPTLLISGVGLVPDIRKSITMDVKQPWNYIYVVGSTRDELGGSEYYAMKGSQVGEAWIGNDIPKVNAAHALKKYNALHEAAQNGFVVSCHDCSDGGLGVAMAEMAFAGGFGMSSNLDYVPRRTYRDDYTLFSETNSRMLVEVPIKYAGDFEMTMSGVSYAHIGRVTQNPYLSILSDRREISNAHIDSLKRAWQGTLNW